MWFLLFRATVENCSVSWWHPVSWLCLVFCGLFEKWAGGSWPCNLLRGPKARLCSVLQLLWGGPPHEICTATLVWNSMTDCCMITVGTLVPEMTQELLDGWMDLDSSLRRDFFSVVKKRMVRLTGLMFKIWIQTSKAVTERVYIGELCKITNTVQALWKTLFWSWMQECRLFSLYLVCYRNAGASPFI